MKFFSSILKQKKIIILTITSFVLLGIILPQFSSAASWWNPFSWGDNLMNSVINALLISIVAIPLIIIMAFVTITKLLLTAIIAFATIGTSYTHSDAVNIGWPIVRDLANMMVVLGFVVIGIATTLRIQEYQAKKTLVPLIITALLINFSLLICGIFIDTSNIVMIFFFNKAGLSAWVPAIVDLSTLFSNISADNILNFAPKLFGMMFFNFIAGFVNLLYMLLILVRVLALWMLVILSPLAFVCYVFPATKSIWQMWWKNFFQWCLIILPAGLFYYIGSQMISNSVGAPNIDLGDIDPVKYITSSISTVLVPGLFLIIGFFVSLQFSAMGSSAIMNFANKNKGKILGGGLGALSKASGKSGEIMGKIAGSSALAPGGSKYNPLTWAKATMRGAAKVSEKGANIVGNYRATSQKTRSGFGRGLEAIGWIDRGVTAEKDAKVVKESADQIKFEYDRAKLNNDRKTIDKIRNDARTAQGAKGAASYKVISDAKDLPDTFKNATGGVDFDAIYSRGRFAETNGAQGVIKENEKLNPAYRRNNEYELEEKAKDMIAAGTIPSVPNAHNNPLYRTQIQDAVEADGFKKAGVQEVKNYHKSVLQTSAFINNIRAKILERAANTELTDEQSTAIKSQIGYLQAQILAIRPAGAPAPVAGAPNYEQWKELTDKLATAVIM